MTLFVETLNGMFDNGTHDIRVEESSFKYSSGMIKVSVTIESNMKVISLSSENYELVKNFIRTVVGEIV